MATAKRDPFRTLPPLRCEHCSARFARTRAWQRFCGKRCQQAWHVARRSDPIPRAAGPNSNEPTHIERLVASSLEDRLVWLCWQQGLPLDSPFVRRALAAIRGLVQ